MSKGTTSYRIKDENALYFLTCATVEWIDVFASDRYKKVFIDNLNFCIEKKGLQIFGWVLMKNHFHLIAKARDGYKLSGIIRDFKKHVSKLVVAMLREENSNRSEWLLNKMRMAALNNSKWQQFQLWRNDNHPIQLFKPATIAQKLKYIHNNPVADGITEFSMQYKYSSAKDYGGRTGLVKIDKV